MKQAANEVYKVCSEQLSKIEYTLIESGEELVNVAVSKVMDLAWDVVLDAACGIGTAFKFGQAIGKAISNFCFSTDKTIEQYYALTALVKFEDVAIKAVNSIAGSFKANQSESNADSYIESVKMLFSVYGLGCDYADTFVNVVTNKGLVNTIENAFGVNETFSEYRQTLSFIKTMINDMKTTLTDFESYSCWYEDDAPTAYIAYFKTTETNPPYSNSVKPLYFEPMASAQDSGASVLKYRVESDDTVTVIGCAPSSFGTITIPKDYAGKAIRKIASNAFSGCTGITEVVMPSTLKEVASQAFSRCTNIASVIFNNGLESIGQEAFTGTKLTTVTIPKTVTSMGYYSYSSYSGSEYPAFYGIDSLKTVIFEEGITAIPKEALYCCKSLSNVVIPEGVSSIGIRAFSGCNNLSSIELPLSLKTIEREAFSYTNIEDIFFNNGLESIGQEAFTGTKLTTVTIPKTVTSMGYYSYSSYSGSEYPAFYGIDSLKTVIFEEGITAIPKEAFYCCKSLSNVVIPEGVSSIGIRAFSGCNNLSSIELPLSLKTIEREAFSYTNIEDIFFNNGLESIGQEAFTGTKLTTVTIPKTVTSMGYYSYSSYSGSEYPAFYGIDSLKTVIFEEGITAIPKEALYCCKSLSNVVIPEGVKMIGNDAFRGCTGITEIAIPDSVTTINASSFSGCTNLKKVYAVKNTAGYKFAIDNNIEIVELTCLHSETELVVDSVQSCETDGVSRYVCKICGVTVSTERKPATGHNYSTEIVLIKATCQASGIKKVICSKCGDVTEQTIPALEHTIVTYGEAKAATCTQTGMTQGKKCSVCGAIVEEAKVVPKTAHKYIATVIKPTCTANGYTTHKCSVCGNTYTDTVVKATGHKNKTTTTPATTSADGRIVTTCTVCGEVLSTAKIYKATSIKLSKTSYTYNGKVQKPTVTVKNSKGEALKNGTDYTVSYASDCKNTGKYAVKITFKGNYSGTKTLYFNILPSKTTKLTATQTTSSIKATWTAVTGATGYKVAIYKGSKAVKTVYTTKTSYTFSKLSKGTTYKVRVTAYKTIDGKKVLSSVYTLLTTATKPGTPTLKVTAGSKKATLSWNKQTGAAGYVVYMATSKNGKYTKIATLKGNTKVSYTKTGLTKGKTYYFKVAAYETVGGKNIYGSFSSVKYAKIK